MRVRWCCRWLVYGWRSQDDYGLGTINLPLGTTVYSCNLSAGVANVSNATTVTTDGNHVVVNAYKTRICSEPFDVGAEVPGVSPLWFRTKPTHPVRFLLGKLHPSSAQAYAQPEGYDIVYFCLESRKDGRLRRIPAH